MRTRNDTVTHIERLYTIQDRGSLWRFLFAHPHLTDVLLEARTYLERHFGPSPRVLLQVTTDPETPGWEHLFASVRTALPLDDALDRLDELLEDWFQVQPSHIDKLFTFSVDCL